jgi:hypothetical protein
VAGSVHLAGGWCEDHGHAGLLEQPEVARLITRILVQVLVGAELGGIHE